MKTYAETVAKVTGNIRACLNDHNITIAEAADMWDITEDEMRHQLTNGDMSIDHCARLYHLTGDMRAFGCTPKP